MAAAGSGGGEDSDATAVRVSQVASSDIRRAFFPFFRIPFLYWEERKAEATTAAAASRMMQQHPIKVTVGPSHEVK